MPTYQEIYPSAAIIRSEDEVRQSARDLLSLEYFEAEPSEMPIGTFDQHHILINLRETPHRVENWRGGEHRDFLFQKDEIVVTPAGLESGWRWHEKSQCIVITLEPRKLEAFTQNELGRILSQQQLSDLPQFKDEDLTSAAVMLLSALRDGGTSSDVMFESLSRVFLVKLINKYGDARGEELSYTRNFTASHYKRVLDYMADCSGSATVRHFGGFA